MKYIKLTGKFILALNILSTIVVAQNPPTPVDDFLIASFCTGNDILWDGTPPAGCTMYWQSSCAGTSLANSGVSYFATTAGTYYIRARNNTTSLWSECRATSPVSGAVVVDDPGNPTGTTPACGSTTLTQDVAGPPAGETWYWQGTTCGTSTLLGTASTYSATSTNTYYIRSREPLAGPMGCWSENCGSIDVTVDALSVGGTVTGGSTICYGAVSGELTLSGETGSVTKWQSSTDSSAWSDITNTNTTYTSGPLTDTNWYRAVVQSGVCASENATPTKVIIKPEPTTITSTSSVANCYSKDENNWVYYVNASNEILTAITDYTGGNFLGSTDVEATIDGSVQNYNGRPYMQRHIGITPATVATSSRVRLYFTQTELDALNTADNSDNYTVNDVRVTKFVGAITSPTGTGTSVSGLTITPNILTNVHAVEFDVSSFSTFFMHFGPVGSPLPIALVDFRAAYKNEQVILNWVTASEVNNDYFTVERSTDMINWEMVAIINGKGNSNKLVYYNTVDDAPYPQLTYYRLKQTDYDGKYEYLDIVTVDCDTSEKDFVITLINITQEKNLIIHFTSAEGELYRVNIFDAMGKQLIEENYIVVEGKNMLQFDVKNFRQGIYMVTIRNDAKNKTIIKKIVVH